MNNRVRCDFCYHMCRLKEGQKGVCNTRKRIGDAIVTTNYGQVVASHTDPIEKKPLYHFFPGEMTFSFALFGCNYTCKFCQNHHLSQKESPLYHQQFPTISPKKLAKEMENSQSKIMSYTYSDPVVWLDYVEDVATEVKQRKKYNSMITNGSFSPSSLQRMLPLIDAFNIDVKGSNDFYKEYCGGALEPVLESVEAIAHHPNTILEVTTLLIEGVHTIGEIVELAKQLHQREVKVWHLSRFYPQYKMKHYPQTSESFLQEVVREVKDVGIPYIYTGNSLQVEHLSTYCPSCHEKIISRDYMALQHSLLNEGTCPFCSEEIYGRFHSTSL